MTYQAFSRVLIVGLGRSGVAAARLATTDGSEVWVTDLRARDDLGGELVQLSGEERLFLGGHPEACLDGVGLVVVSPGVPADAGLLQTARRLGIPVVTEVEFAWRHRPAAPLVAVTGSNGKSTVTELVAMMLNASGRATVAGGNLGTAASQLVHEGGWYEPNAMLLLPPSAFFIIGFIVWGIRSWKPEQQEKSDFEPIPLPGEEEGL